ncbi:MAG: response regulator [bacterium]
MTDKQLILIVDDEEDNIVLLEKRLKASGFDTISARDGDEALELAFKYVPQLILLDIMMPKKDGYEVLEILRRNEKTKDLPVILLTARAEIPDKIRGLELGAEDYVTKPFDFKELLARINSHLETKKEYEEKIKIEKLVALSTMMMGVAHEVRNPLVVIGGFAKKLLSMTDESDPRYRYIAAIEKEVARLEKMIKDIYEFKTIAVVRNEEIYLKDFLQSILNEYQEKFEKQKIQLITNFSSQDRLFLMDKENLKKAFRNIIDNAIEAMPNGGTLIVETDFSSSTLVIQISDTGAGIKEEDLKFVFDPFFTSKMEGTGLGLTLAMKIIEQHNGTISIKSSKGFGTKVTIELSVS